MPPHSGAVLTVRVRARVPPPHVLLQAPVLFQPVMTQFTGAGAGVGAGDGAGVGLAVGPTGTGVGGDGAGVGAFVGLAVGDGVGAGDGGVGLGVGANAVSPSLWPGPVTGVDGNAQEKAPEAPVFLLQLQSTPNHPTAQLHPMMPVTASTAMVP